MGFVVLILIGTAAGFLATRAMGMRLGTAQTIALGVIGAIIGSLVLRVLSFALGIFAGLLGAVLGAILLLWLYKVFIERR